MNLLKLSLLPAALIFCFTGVSALANSISIESPMPGSVIKAGNVCNVAWSSEGTIQSVDIDLSTDNGATWRSLVKYYDNKGSFTCFIPYFTAPQCKIRIADVDGSAEDISGTFSLLAGTLSLSVPKIDSATYPVLHGMEFTILIWLKNTGEALVLLNSSLPIKSSLPTIDWLAVAPGLPSFILPGDSLELQVVLNKGGVITSDAALTGAVKLAFNSSTEYAEIAIATRVKAFNIEPFFDSVRLNSEVDEGGLLTERVHAFDSESQPLTLWAKNLPENAVFVDYHDGSGWLTWQTDYNDSGFYKVTYYATDGIDTVWIDCYIRVGNVNRAPQLTVPGHQYVAALKNLTFNFAATDPDSDPVFFGLNYTIPNCGIAYGNGNGAISFEPSESQVGDLDISIFATDGADTTFAIVPVTVDPSTAMSVTACETCSPPGPFGDILTSDPIIINFSHAVDESSLCAHVSIISRRQGRLDFHYNEYNRAFWVLRPGTGLADLDTIDIVISAGVKSHSGEVLQSDFVRQFRTGPVIYPGDLNNDGVVDEHDLFPLGLYFGQTGPTRLRYYTEGQPLPEPAHRWANVSATYADANGSGKVDFDDICYISQYWGWHRTGDAPVNRQPLDLAAAGIDDARLSNLRAALSSCPPSFGSQALMEALGGGSSVEEPALPKTTELFANYPNPFNPTTTISYQLATPGQVRVTVFNTLGQAIRTLVDESRDAGAGAVEWDGMTDAGNSVASGVYFYRLEAGDYAKTRSLLLLK